MTLDCNFLQDSGSSFGFRFKKWDIYQDARQFRKQIIEIVKKFPSEETFSLGNQLRRAVTSILLNIAEGSNRFTDKETRQFINRAHGSLDEVVSCLDCALDDGYLSLEQYQTRNVEAESLAKRLRAFSDYLVRK